MFCPNCGTQNQETAQTCTKCGFSMKSAAPKFKGTMLMMNQAGGPGSLPGPPPPAAPPPAAGPSSVGVGAPSAGAAPGTPSRLKGTIVGVAPP
ncbi:MAG: zinc ribbon domain-containing protein, partial [Labilithrix sp.]|nr:zinc ribbon domain-containing protein [Labilithrix sp.]